MASTKKLALLIGGVVLAAVVPASGALPRRAPATPEAKAARPAVPATFGILPSFAARGDNLVRLQVGAFDPLRQALPRPAGIAWQEAPTLPAGRSTYWLVQVKGERFAEVAQAITAVGAQRVGNVPDSVYMVRATPAQRQALASHPAVRWTGLYQPAWRVPVAMHGRPGLLDVPGRQVYRVHLFRTHPDPSAVGRAVARISGVRVVSDARVVIDIEAERAQVPALAALDGVEWVTMRPTAVPLNNNTRWVIDTGERDVYGATKVGRLTGAGQTASVADTGVNYKPDKNGRAHVAFRDCNAAGTVCEEADYTQQAAGVDTALLTTIKQHNPAGTHRKMSAFFDLGDVGPNPPDESSHGTHVAGSVAGDAGVHGVFDGHDGMAPEARLVFQSIADSGGGLNTPTDYYQLFRQAYRPRSPSSVPEAYDPADYANYRPVEDARTHNNSYGLIIPVADPFAEAIAIDRFVWEHEDMSIVVSAGNSGPSLLSAGAPAVNKNGFMSGASSNGGQPMVAIDSMTNFSSHGPTGDGRFGITVATPGEAIASPKGGTVDADHYLQGTSMSGPVLTGALTLARQYFWDGYGPAAGSGFPTGSPSVGRRHNPSAALIKAAVVNGATRMRGWYTGDEGTERSLDGQWPSAGQGFGLVNLDNSLYFAGDPVTAWYHDVYRAAPDAFPVSNGETRSYEIRVTEGAPLDVTLAWTDAPDLLPAGTPNSVNNLNLVVEGPEGRVYVGNNANTRLAPDAAVAETPDDPDATADVINNVERVTVPNPVSGFYTVRVDAPVVADGPQGFALAAAGRLSPPDTTFTPGAARQPDEPGKPSIGDVRVEPVSADLARVTFTTSEPTRASVTVSGVDHEFADVYTLTGEGYYGIDTSVVETSPAYSGTPVVGTRHEVLVTGLEPGTTYTPTVKATDLAGNAVTSTGESFRSPDNSFQPRAPDMAQFASDEFTDLGPLAALEMGDQWAIGKQLYAGTDGAIDFLGAFMFRLPASVDPNKVVGAQVEFSSAHDISSHYTANPLFGVELLEESVEADWGTQTFSEIADAETAARLSPDSTIRRGANERIAYTFSCTELDALKATLEADSDGARNAAFRFVSSDPGDVSLVSMEFGFNRRSRGAHLRPKLVLQTAASPAVPPFTPCNPTTPAPTISDVGIHPGLSEDAVGVSWRTDVNSSSVVLFREKGATAWTQVASPAMTQLHQIQVRGLDEDKSYEFGVRSVACNGARATADNAGRGWDFFSRTGAPLSSQSYDFESSAQGWTTSTQVSPGETPYTGSEWERRSPGHESEQAWYAMPYGDHAATNLVSPLINVGGTLTRVSFYAAWDFEPSATAATTSGDGLYVDYSTDGTAWANAGVLQDRNLAYPAFELQQMTFPTAPGPLRIRLRVSGDPNISSPPFEGAKVDTVSIVSYATSGGSRPTVGPYPPPSAGATALNLAAVPPATAVTERDRTAGTGVCVGAAGGPGDPGTPPPGPGTPPKRPPQRPVASPDLPATGGSAWLPVLGLLLVLLAASRRWPRRGEVLGRRGSASSFTGSTQQP